jgi:hypothetical protein
MDTKTLVVGQKVVMESGPYGCLGTVVKATPEGVIVRTDLHSNITLEGQLCRFDINGKACDSSDLGYESTTQKGGIPGRHECGPWELTDHDATAFLQSIEQERARNIEKAAELRRKYEATRSSGC